MNRYIQVEAHWAQDGMVRPDAFLWRGERHPVRSVGRQWVEQGWRHVLVMVGDQSVFELGYDTATGSWSLLRSPEAFGPGPELI